MFIVTELYSIFWWIQTENWFEIPIYCDLDGDFTKKLVTRMDGAPYSLQHRQIGNNIYKEY